MFDLQSFLSGLALGLAGKPLALAREPVAYLYNGVRLPKLPEWDRVDYPYAAIVRQAIGDELHLWISTNVYAEMDANASEQFRVVAPRVLYHVVDGKWEIYGEFSNDSYYYNGEIWTNRDLIKLDGTLYMAASEPIPVYE